MAGAQALSLVTLAAVGTAAALPVSDAELRGVTDALAANVSAVRHLPAPRGLESHLVTRAEAFAARAEAVAATATRPEEQARARLWQRLGLLPVGADYARLMARSFGPPTAGYDPVRRRLSVPDWLPLVEQQAAIAHELAHAIADQRFDLRQLLQIGLDGHHRLDGDAERARLALVEGDAAVTALERDDPRGTFSSRPELFALAQRLRAAPPAGTPPWIRAGATFEHADGLLFVARVRARAPWSAVDALWSDPPASSEQVLHPAKYDARERPVPVTVERPQALDDTWREAASDVLGELGVRTWLAASVPPALAERAAAGWGGDRAVLYEPAVARERRDAGTDAGDAGADAGAARAPAPFVAWSTVWDDPTDAEDFARAAAVVLATLSGDEPAAAPDDPHHVVARANGVVYALAWRGAGVSLLIGAPEETLGALEDMLPKDTKPPKKKPARR